MKRKPMAPGAFPAIVTIILLTFIFSGCPEGRAGLNELLQPSYSLPSGNVDPQWFPVPTMFAIKDKLSTQIADEDVANLEVTNAVITWALRDGAKDYRVFRDGEFVMETTGNKYEDYGLAPGGTFRYIVAAYDEAGNLKALSQTAEARPFIATGTASWRHRFSTYTRDTIVPETGGSSDALIYNGYEYAFQTAGNTTTRYFQYRRRTNDGAGTTGAWSTWTNLNEGKDGVAGTSRLNIGSWTGDVNGAPTTINPDCFVPSGTNFTATGNNLEGQHWFNLPEKQKGVLVCHREESSGYTLAHVLIVHCYINNGSPYAEMTYSGRPFGFQSRDQRAWAADDGTPYVLTSQMGTISFFKLDPDWREPVEATNTGLWQGSGNRETPDIVSVGGTLFFACSRQNGWYPSQTAYATGVMGGNWTPLVNLGNATALDGQFNRFETYSYGGGKKAVSTHSYRWAGSRGGIQAGTTTQRMAIVSINGTAMASEYFPNIAFHPDYGLIGIRTGRFVSLGKRVVAASSVRDGVSQDHSKLPVITDGYDSRADLPEQSFRNNSVPYSVTVDLGSPHRLNEVTVTNKTTGGSDASLQFRLLGSMDGQAFSTIDLFRNGSKAVTGAQFTGSSPTTSNCNGLIGFTPCDIHTDQPYRYVRLTVTGAVNGQNSNANVYTWSGDIIELALYGMPAN